MYQIQTGSTPINMNHGTTTLGFLFDHGIIIAVDSRASAASYIASQTTHKVLEVCPYMLATMAGGAADCQYWHRVLQKEVRLFEFRNRRKMSIAGASQTFSNIMFSYKGMGLSVGSMIAGWDSEPRLYYVDSDGQRTKGTLFSVGSGSTHAYGILDKEYRHDLSVAEAIELGARAIYHATHRDSYSGGTANVYFIDALGWHRTQYYLTDIAKFYPYDQNPPLPVELLVADEQQARKEKQQLQSLPLSSSTSSSSSSSAPPIAAH
nr:proteasome subunit beta type-5 [Paratrimastix eleionoma]